MFVVANGADDMYAPVSILISLIFPGSPVTPHVGISSGASVIRDIMSTCMATPLRKLSMPRTSNTPNNDHGSSSTISRRLVDYGGQELCVWDELDAVADSRSVQHVHPSWKHTCHGHQDHLWRIGLASCQRQVTGHRVGRGRCGDGGRAMATAGVNISMTGPACSPLKSFQGSWSSCGGRGGGALRPPAIVCATMLMLAGVLWLCRPLLGQLGLQGLMSIKIHTRPPLGRGQCLLGGRLWLRIHGDPAHLPINRAVGEDAVAVTACYGERFVEELQGVL